MQSFDISKMIDESKFNRFHAIVLFWCSFIIVFDGFDLVVYGTVVPALMKEWHLTPIMAGTLGSYALFGMLIGALVFGSLADKVGRKNVILFCIFIFSVFTVLIGCWAKGPTEFGIYRFLAGLGLGGVMPNTVALMTEYSPRRMRSTLVSIMFSGYSVGGMLAASLGIVLIPKFGWESVFFVGAIPLFMLPLMYKSLPDSPNFYIVKNKLDKLGGIASKIAPGFKLEDDQYKIAIPQKIGISVAKLFENQRTLSTIMFWISFFMCLLMVYGLNTWLPKLMTTANYPMRSSLMFLFVLNFGAIFGAIFGGWVADRWSAKKVLVIFYLLAAVSLTMLGFKANTFVLYVLVAVAGATTIGTQIIANAYVSQYYPSHMRSTGIGWALGIGRLGAIVGPMMGGFLLSMDLPLMQNFLAFAIPGLIAAITIWFVQDKHAERNTLSS